MKKQYTIALLTPAMLSEQCFDKEKRCWRRFRYSSAYALEWDVFPDVESHRDVIGLPIEREVFFAKENSDVAHPTGLIEIIGPEKPPVSLFGEPTKTSVLDYTVGLDKCFSYDKWLEQKQVGT
jgi:hypothetical protein